MVVVIFAAALSLSPLRLIEMSLCVVAVFSAAIAVSFAVSISCLKILQLSMSLFVVLFF